MIDHRWSVGTRDPRGGVPGIPGGYHGALGGYQGPRGGPLGHQRASGIPIGLGDPNGPRGSPGSIEVGVLGLKNGRGGGGVCVIQMLELYLKWEGGGRKEEGGRTGFEIKSNNPNLKGGGKKNEKSLFWCFSYLLMFLIYVCIFFCLTYFHFLNVFIIFIFVFIPAYCFDSGPALLNGFPAYCLFSGPA